MEEKKSHKADLEKKRTTNFLLGLVTVLAIFVALLEFNTRSSSVDDGYDALDDLAQDVEMAPIVQHKDMRPVEVTPPQSTLIEKINIVDEDVKDLETKDEIKPDDNLSEDLSSLLGIDRTEPLDDQSQIAVDEDENPLDFLHVEHLPEFPGGMTEFMKWLTKTLKYPMLARQKEIEGKVIVSFIINTDGTVVSPKIIQSADPELDREALRVVRIMPKWKAGEDNGKLCRTYMCLPIVFKL